MFKDDYIEKLIERTIECPKNMDNEEIIKLYNEVQNVFKSFKYSKEEKEKLKRKGQLESLTMIYDGIKQHLLTMCLTYKIVYFFDYVLSNSGINKL